MCIHCILCPRIQNTFQHFGVMIYMQKCSQIHVIHLTTNLNWMCHMYNVHKRIWECRCLCQTIFTNTTRGCTNISHTNTTFPTKITNTSCSPVETDNATAYEAIRRQSNDYVIIIYKCYVQKMSTVGALVPIDHVDTPISFKDPGFCNETSFKTWDNH